MWSGLHVVLTMCAGVFFQADQSVRLQTYLLRNQGIEKWGWEGGNWEEGEGVEGKGAQVGQGKGRRGEGWGRGGGGGWNVPFILTRVKKRIRRGYVLI